MSNEKLSGEWLEAEEEFKALLGVMLEVRRKDLETLKNTAPKDFPSVKSYAGDRDLSEGHQDLEELISLEQEILEVYEKLERDYNALAAIEGLDEADKEVAAIDARLEQYQSACDEEIREKLQGVIQGYIANQDAQALRAAYVEVLTQNMPVMDDLSPQNKEILKNGIEAYQEGILGAVEGFSNAHAPKQQVSTQSFKDRIHDENPERVSPDSVAHPPKSPNSPK